MAGTRILGLDFGAKTVGVAVTDALMLTAQPLLTIRRERENKLRQTLAKIEELCTEYEVERIVLGKPVGLDGAEGDRCEKTGEFKEMLERRLKLPVDYVDERFTTAEADRILELGGVKAKDRKVHSDEMAASLILQTWLDKTDKNDGKD